MVAPPAFLPQVRCAVTDKVMNHVEPEDTASWRGRFRILYELVSFYLCLFFGNISIFRKIQSKTQIHTFRGCTQYAQSGRVAILSMAGTCALCSIQSQT